MVTINKFEFAESTSGNILESARHRKQIEFVNIAAHEMKAPLQAILTYSEMLHKFPYNGATYASPILRNAKRLQRLAFNLLDLSRLENQSLILVKETFDLTELISYAVDDLVPSLSKKYQNLQLVKPTSTIFVHADKERISQIIYNLLSNAIKFTREGVIAINTEEISNPHEVIITIKDNGLGIDPSVLPMLFTKFVSTSPEGLGLGLFITKNIIEAHDGRIWAQNNPDGNGATFSFTLPL